MEDTNKSKKTLTHVRIPTHLKKRLDKIQKDSGKTLINVTIDIVKLGIETYYNKEQ